jgi:hypothetical protein
MRLLSHSNDLRNSDQYAVLCVTTRLNCDLTSSWQLPSGIYPMADFVPGLELGEQFFTEAAKPIIVTYFRGLRYSAAMLGWNSEVLGYDDVECEYRTRFGQH